MDKEWWIWGFEIGWLVSRCFAEVVTFDQRPEEWEGRSHIGSLESIPPHTVKNSEIFKYQGRLLRGWYCSWSPLLLICCFCWFFKSCVFFWQPKCRAGPAFLLVLLPNIFNSRMHMVTPGLCVVFLFLGTSNWEHVSQLPLQFRLGPWEWDVSSH